MCCALVIVFPVRSRALPSRGRDWLFSVLLPQPWLWFSPAPQVYAPVSTRIDFCYRGICFSLPSTSVLKFPLCFFRSASGLGRPHAGSAACSIFPLSWRVLARGSQISSLLWIPLSARPDRVFSLVFSAHRPDRARIFLRVSSISAQSCSQGRGFFVCASAFSLHFPSRPWSDSPACSWILQQRSFCGLCAKDLSVRVVSRFYSR
jgi:hypothetical protein